MKYLAPTTGLLIGLGLTVLWFLSGIRLQVEGHLRSSLETVLETTDKAIQTWVEAEEKNVTVLANTDELKLSVEQQLRIGRNVQLLRTSEHLKRIRNLLEPALKVYQIPGFVIIAPDGFQIAARLDQTIGTSDVVDHSPNLLSRVIAGTEATLGLPYLSLLYIDAETHKPYPLMTFAAPIRNQAGEVIAALALRADPRLDLTRTTRLARLEKTGETYLFDRDGRLLSESRFDDQLRKAGLLPSDSPSILNVEIRDPGGNTVEGYSTNIPRHQQPLTRMAQSAVIGNDGIDIGGYRDYRGVPVIGAWLWDNRLRMGLSTEMDLNEAFEPYRHFRNLLLFVLSAMLGVSILLLLILRHRDRLLLSNQAYRQAMSARDDMMAIVAHDLRNPLNAMLLRSHIMLQQAAGCGGSESQGMAHNLGLLQKTARHMDQLIGDLTDSVKINAGRLRLDRQQCTLQQAVEPAIERMRLLSREKLVEFTADIPTDTLRLSADQSRITQVLDNLLGNSLKFTPSGGKITVRINHLGNEAQVSVADTGPGIPDQALSRIFEPYWQVQKTRTGMGLGLFIARTIIDGHGGRIWVESSLGQGTTFYFTLPLNEQADKTD